MESTLQSLIQCSKQAFEINLVQVHSSSCKRLYRYLRYLRTGNCGIGAITHNSITVVDQARQVEIFNDYFNSTFIRSDYSLPCKDSLPSPSSHLDNIDVTLSDVFEALCALDTSKAYGCDGISPLILKSCSTALLDSIFHLTSTCYGTLTFPDDWKVHKIIPIPKKADSSEVNNFRPISLLCIVSKILESIVFKKIISFVSPLICHQQFGFMKNKSCLSQLLCFLSDIHKSVDEKVSTDVIYFDFKKAFDTVGHQELLFKLWRLGITGHLWDWFHEYLINREHYVCIGNTSSSSLPVHSGVPQGSILGPLLFLIFVNDLPTAICNSSIYLFTDDTNFCKTIRHPGESAGLQEDINNLSSWCQEWNMSLHPGKSVALHFCLSGEVSSDYSTDYSIDGTPVRSVKHHRDLGVILSSDLSWSSHHHHICSRAYRSLYLIRRSFSCALPIKLKKLLYLTVVRSHLTYCSQVWRPRLIKDCMSIERVQ